MAKRKAIKKDGQVYDLPIKQGSPQAELTPRQKYWLNKKREPATVKKLPGRNDPCICGKDIKYKKCCLK
jgi:uncharacterized protein YecA (UPF0149 family)